MNLYDLHSKPEKLKYHDVASEHVPDVVWAKYQHDHEQLRKHEDVLAKDPKTALAYALNVLKRKRFYKGEDAIGGDKKWAYIYADVIVHGRFPKGEDVIAKDPALSYQYAKVITKQRFPKGENAIAKDPTYAYWYARDVIGGRWPKGEDAIAKNPTRSIQYAIKVLKKRFEKGEDAISRDHSKGFFSKQRYNQQFGTKL